MGALERRQIAERAHVDHRCHPALGDVVHRRIERPIAQLMRRRRLNLVDDGLGVVLHDARRAAARVAHYGSAFHVARRLGHSGGCERCPVGKRHVSIQTGDPHGIVRSYGIDPVASGQLTAPILMVPVAAGDPCAGWNSGSIGFDASDEFGRCPRIAQLDR